MPPPNRLSGALDNDVLVAVQKFMHNGVSADVTSLYTALQRSNSSLKRLRKSALEASIQRVLDFVQPHHQPDPESMDTDDEIEKNMPPVDISTDLLNKSIRANLASRPSESSNSHTDMLDKAKKRKLEEQPSQKRSKRSDTSATIVPPEQYSLYDLGGLGEVIGELIDLVIAPLGDPDWYHEVGIPSAKGVLLHGPPGCGKTMTVRTLAAAMGKPFIEILGPSVVSGMSGESERGIRERFDEAKKNAPCILFIDEIDAIAPKRDSSGSQMEKRIVTQLLVSMDELNRDPDKTVVVLAATNRPDSIDPALRREGRFGTEINIPVPNEHARAKILKAQTRNKPTKLDLDFDELAKRTAGFVGADLQGLVAKVFERKRKDYFAALEREAIDHNLCQSNGDNDPTDADLNILKAERIIARLKRPDIPRPAQFQDKSIGMEDFLTVIPTIVPSSKREGFATVPDVSWKDVGVKESVRKELQALIVDRIRHPKRYAEFGYPPSSGIILWGPPGCGKTLLAKAVAAESHANFISVKGPELLNKFVGESEAAVRKVFARARSSVPCVVFFDEFDALVPRRDDGGGTETAARVVQTFLTELDGTSDRDGIHVIAATNRIETIDRAILRPGRIESQVFIDLPGSDERVDILKALARTRPCTISPDIERLIRGQGCEGLSGADLLHLLSRATLNAMERQATSIEFEDFASAANLVKPSVRDSEHYRRLRDVLAKTPT